MSNGEKILGYVERVSTYRFRTHLGERGSNRQLGSFQSLANAQEPLNALAARYGLVSWWEQVSTPGHPDTYILKGARALGSCDDGEIDDFVEVGYSTLSQWFANRGFFQFIKDRPTVQKFEFKGASFEESGVSRDLTVILSVDYIGARSACIKRNSDGKHVWESKTIQFCGDVNLGKQRAGESFTLVLRGMPPAFASVEVPQGPFLDAFSATSEGTPSQLFVRATYRLAASAQVLRQSDDAVAVALPQGSQDIAQAFDLPGGFGLSDAYKLSINEGELVSEPSQPRFAFWSYSEHDAEARVPFLSGETFSVLESDPLWVDTSFETYREDISWADESGNAGTFPGDFRARYASRDFSFLERVSMLYRGTEFAHFFVVRTVEPRLQAFSIASNGTATQLTYSAIYRGAADARIVRQSDGVTVLSMPKGSFSGTDVIDLSVTGTRLSDGFKLVLNRGVVVSEVQSVPSSITSWSVSSVKPGLVLDYAASYRGAAEARIVRVSDGATVKTLAGGTTTERGSVDLSESGTNFSDSFRLSINFGAITSEAEHVTPAILSFVVNGVEGQVLRYSVSYRAANNARIVRVSDGLVVQDLPGGCYAGSNQTVDLSTSGSLETDAFKLVLNDGALSSS